MRISIVNRVLPYEIGLSNVKSVCYRHTFACYSSLNVRKEMQND